MTSNLIQNEIDKLTYGASGSSDQTMRVALVTGGASGIGLAATRRFVQDGSVVVVGDVDERALASLREELGSAVRTSRCDVAVEADVESLADLAVEQFGRLDIAFANAGIFRREIHDHLAKLPETQHVIVDAVAIADIDFTGMTALAQVVADLDKDKTSIAFSRANDTVKGRLKKSTNDAIKTIALFDSTDAAAVAAEAATKS